MTTTRKAPALPEYADIVDYAEAIAVIGRHDAKATRTQWTTVELDGDIFITDAKRGGRCYAVTDLTGGDPRMVEAVRRTAALRTR